MIPMETKFNDDIVVRFSVITENVHFSFIREYRGATLRSPCDVIDDVITTKNTFSCIIWDAFFISGIRLNLCIVCWHFQNGRDFDVPANFFTGIIPEVDYARKIATSVSHILSF